MDSSLILITVAQAAQQSVSQGVAPLTAQPNVAAAPASNGVLTIGWAFFLLAIVIGGVTLGFVYFFFRTKRRDWSAAYSLLSGGFASGFFGALGSQIKGLAFTITWAEGAVVSLALFVGWFVVWSLIAVVLYEIFIVSPLRNRFGAAIGVQARLDLIEGIDSLRKNVSKLSSFNSADKVWDEFSCAFNEVSLSLEPAVRTAKLNASGLHLMQLLKPGTTSYEEVVAMLRKAIATEVNAFCARLSHSTLNFTVWRVAKDRDELEHILSLPVEPGHEAGYGKKTPLPIWSDSHKSHHGSLAAKVMLNGKFDAMTEEVGWDEKWPRRHLGSDYSSVAAMPIPCDSDSDSPWAVVCVENRDGALPLTSNAMRQLLAWIARAVQTTEWKTRLRTIDETRQIAENQRTGLAGSGISPSGGRLSSPAAATPPGVKSKGDLKDFGVNGVPMNPVSSAAQPFFTNEPKMERPGETGTRPGDKAISKVTEGDEVVEGGES